MRELNHLSPEHTRQHHGVWEREFLFDHSDGRFELCEEEAKLEDGVLAIVLKWLVILSGSDFFELSGKKMKEMCFWNLVGTFFCRSLAVPHPGSLCSPERGSSRAKLGHARPTKLKAGSVGLGNGPYID